MEELQPEELEESMQELGQEAEARATANAQPRSLVASLLVICR